MLMSMNGFKRSIVLALGLWDS
ncbi:hypothetical protein SBA3_520020 [Candidatus Sulfopaludibacter sp. SbA3]|nr:hypothetical protein SBA3_520020 [Candidatus Sulfopaludibacter sp. SbA3]